MKYLVIAVMVAVLATASYADLNAYEGFDYTVGSELVGSAGGTGWTAAWTSSAAEPSNTFTIGTDITYTDGSMNSLITSGGSFLMTKSSGPANVALPRTIPAITSGEVYLSALFTQIGDGAYDYFFQLGNGSTYEGLTARGSWPATYWKWSSTDMSGMPLPAQGETQFLVLKVDLGAGTVDAWQNPDLTTPGTPGYSGAIGLSNVDSIRFFVKNEVATENYAWDEVRIGTAFADVAPVIPEPAMGILALLGAFALRFRK